MEITEAQKEKVPEYIEKWIKLTSEQFTFEQARDAIYPIYEDMNLSRPTVFLLDSPVTAAIAPLVMRAVGTFYDKRNGERRNEELCAKDFLAHYNDTFKVVKEVLDTYVDDKFFTRDVVANVVRDMGEQWHVSLKQYGNPSNAELGKGKGAARALAGELKRQLGDVEGIREKLKSVFSDSYIGFWWSAWACYYDFLNDCGVDFEQDKYEKFMNWCRYSSALIPYDGAAFIIRRPECHWIQQGEQHVLNNEEGPAVKWDTYERWFIEGVSVDEQIVMRPETLTLDQIMGESDNSDKRSIMLARFGWHRVVDELKLHPIDTRDNETENTIEALYDTPFGRRLIATCPTGRIVDMGVPESVKTCKEAAEYFKPRKFNILART